MSTVPHFMTHHAPVGAWASLTFGLPGRGVSIDHEDLAVQDTADLLLAYTQGPGRTVALPFVTGAPISDQEGHAAAPESATAGAYRKRWSYLHPSSVRRTLTACVDTFETDRLTLRVYTPHASIPNPKRAGFPQFSVCPGLLLELTIDNSHSDEPAHGFIGLGYRGKGRLRPMDWSTNGALVGVGLSSNWGLAARAAEGIGTVRDNVIAAHVENGRPIVHNGGNEGGILIAVGPRETKTVQLAFGFFHGGPVTQGIEGTYYYTKFFQDLESVVTFVLKNVDRIKESCDVFDKKVAATCADETKRAILAQGLRGYYANTQLILSNNIPYYSVNEGQYCWRNTLDLAADHIPWELYRNPWVVRNVFDLYSAHYSYRDELVFPGDPEPAKLQPGGLTYCHDTGSYTAYSPAGTSGYEMPDHTGVYSYMSSEQLLNGIYLLTSYAIASEDEPWARTRLATARELLDSLEARDHHDAAQRNGILKAESSTVGVKGREITTYDALDPALASARGNLYIALKTWGAMLMMTAYFQQHNDNDSAQRAYNFAHLTANSLLAAFDKEKKRFPANLFETSDTCVIAALEALAVPAVCNLKHYFAEFPALMDALRDHARTCLQQGVCIDAATGGMRLSSTSENTWPSKTILVLYVLETILGFSLADYPTLLPELAGWMQVAAAERTLSDQVHVTDRKVIGGSYYPRMVTAAVWLKND